MPYGSPYPSNGYRPFINASSMAFFRASRLRSVIALGQFGVSANRLLTPAWFGHRFEVCVAAGWKNRLFQHAWPIGALAHS